MATRFASLLQAGRVRQWTNAARELIGARNAPEPGAPAGELTNSPLLAGLVAQCAERPRCHVLDLGPAIGSNIAFFQQLHCKLEIADCGAELLRLSARGEDDATPLDAQLARLLPVDPDEPYDAILAWDLLNYLDKPLFAALTAHLAPAVTGDTHLHAYIGARRTLAAEPAQYRLQDDGRVEVLARSTATRECPCYHQMELRHLLPQFGVVRSMLLQNGMQEYLFKGQGRGHRTTARRG